MQAVIKGVTGDFVCFSNAFQFVFVLYNSFLGLKTVVAGKIGKDPFGDIILSTLRKSRVCTDYMIASEELKTGVTVALCKENDRAMLTYSGTIDAMKPEDIPWDVLEQSRHLHIGSYFLLKSVQKCFPDMIDCIHKNKGTVSLDTNWDPEEKWESGLKDILSKIDVFFPNENEAIAITGESSAEKAINILKDNIPVVAVKLGPKGAITYYKGESVFSPSIDVPKVDAVGAGDSFDAGFVYGYITGEDIKTCTRMGNITGSLNIRGEGGTQTQPFYDEFIKYLEK
jgi:sugar/nucleoside kinase (ribokinase family)